MNLKAKRNVLGAPHLAGPLDLSANFGGDYEEEIAMEPRRSDENENLTAPGKTDQKSDTVPEGASNEVECVFGPVWDMRTLGSVHSNGLDHEKWKMRASLMCRFHRGFDWGGYEKVALSENEMEIGNMLRQWRRTGGLRAPKNACRHEKGVTPGIHKFAIRVMRAEPRRRRPHLFWKQF